MSPTVLQSGPYRLSFFSSDRAEPVHIHVARDRKAAKFWLAPVRLEYNHGFAPTELTRVASLVRQHEPNCGRLGMNTSTLATETPLATGVKITDAALIVDLQDGRVVSVPLSWYPRLAAATPSERRRWRLIGPGIGIHWPAVDEDVSVGALLRGLRSNESGSSLRRWKAARRSVVKVAQTKGRARRPGGAKRPTQAVRG